MFVDGLEFIFVLAQLDTEVNILTKFQNNLTSGLEGDTITRNVYRRTVGRTGGCRRVTSRRANNTKRALKFR